MHHYCITRILCPKEKLCVALTQRLIDICVYESKRANFFVKEIWKNNKETPSEWEKIFINSVSDKGPYQTHKESNIFITIKIKLSSLLMQNIPEYSLLNRRQKWPKKKPHEKCSTLLNTRRCKTNKQVKQN